MTRSSGPVFNIAAFARVLSAAGLAADVGRLMDCVRGLSFVDMRDREQFYWTLRQNLVSSREDLGLFDVAFRTWFDAAQSRGVSPEKSPEVMAVAVGGGSQGSGPNDSSEPELGGSFSPHESFYTKDFGQMSASELATVRKLLVQSRRQRPQRVSRRMTSLGSGRRIDVREMIRSAGRHDGELLERRFRARRRVHRQLVFLCDVSGSMEPYARAMLIFAYVATQGATRAEIYTFGTELTRVTKYMRGNHAETALSASTRHIRDWSGGTRIGESLEVYNKSWGDRSGARGAIVIIMSDGWEIDDASMVARQMKTLASRSYAVVWVNPLKGDPQYEPLAAGMRAALPHIDRLVPGHNFSSLDSLGQVLESVGGRHRA